MIDRDDREGDRDGDDRSQVEHNQAETTPADGTANGDESAPADKTAVADEAPREDPAPEEQPAMQLAGGSDEGGTVSEANEPEGEQPVADDGVEDASEDAVDENEPGFDGR